MKSAVVEVGEGFWNIRDTFRMTGVDIGTQASLVRCRDGRYVFLDACRLSVEDEARIDRLTKDGKQIKAILNLHPFHTMRVADLHALYPEARLYGTARHKAKLPDLPWQKLETDDQELHRKFAGDLEFTVPEGVDFVSENDRVHFSSVMAYHPGSATIHVNDTLMYVTLPQLLGAFGLRDALSFHPSLLFALQKYPGAAEDFEEWAMGLAESWGAAKNLCAAHSGVLLGEKDLAGRIGKALKRVKWVLAMHRLRTR